MIANVYIHLVNDLPVVADVYALPERGDLTLRCTNVRTVDGKRPSFVHDSAATFVFPLSVIRMIEVPPTSAPGSVPQEAPSEDVETASIATTAADEEPDPDLLARIRGI